VFTDRQYYLLGAVLATIVFMVVPPVPQASAQSCVRAKYTGDASTYNPNKAGYKTGGQKLATGGTYNANGYEAALQLDLAKKHSCGYGAGKVCHAAVEYRGKAMIVKINDNGPLCADSGVRCAHRFERIIDLNEKSMRYLSGGALGGNSGLLKGVTVTLLCDFNAPLGPLDEKDRDAWKNKYFGGSNTPFPTNTSAPTGYPTTVGTPTGGVSGQSQSSYYEKADFSNYQSPQPYAPTGQQLTPSNYFSSSGSGLFDPITGEPRSPVSASDSLLKLLKGSTALKQPSTTLSIIVASGKQASLVPTVKTKISQQVAQKGTTTGATFTGPYAGTPRSSSSFQTTLSDIQDQIASILKMLGDLVR